MPGISTNSADIARYDPGAVRVCRRDPSPELLADCRRRIVDAHASVLEPLFGSVLAPAFDAEALQALYERFVATAPARSLDPLEVADRFLAWLVVEAGAAAITAALRGELRAALHAADRR